VRQLLGAQREENVTRVLCVSLLLLVLGAQRAQAAAPPAAPPRHADKSVELLLREAQIAYQKLDYDEVVPIVAEVLAREGLSADQKLDAYLLQGTSLAVIGDPIEAETSFRLLLRGRPSFDLPADTAPKILAVFRKVQIEERAIAGQLGAMERQRIISELKLNNSAPAKITGGSPLVFAYRLRDTRNAVEAFSVWYRRGGDPSFSALALQRDEEGIWRGALPGEWTASEQGFALEYHLETSDDDGPLLTAGSAAQPLLIEVAPGSVEDAAPPPLPLWSFAAVAGTAIALGITASGTAVATLIVQQDHDAMAERSRSEVLPGSELAELRSTGQALALATTVLWVSSGVMALAAGGMALFVDWSGE